MRFRLIVAPLLISVCLGQFASGQNTEKHATKGGPGRWALLIGVDDYTELGKLRFAGNDQRALAEQLTAVGFPEDQVFVMHDKANESRYLPFRENIEKQLELVLGMASRGDLVIVGFSGHGVQIEDKSYLCPADARLERLEATSISMESVYNRLAKSRATLKLFLVDACRNDLVPAGRRSVALTRSLGEFASMREKPPEGIMLLASCGPSQVSMEDADFKHGVFMHYLLEGLQGQAANSDGAVTLAGLYDYASLETKKYVAHKFNESQTPAIRGDINGPFEICRKTGPRVAEMKPYTEKIPSTDVTFDMVPIPGGEFTMGSAAGEKGRKNDEGPQVRAKIEPFWMGKCEVTWDEYELWGLGLDRQRRQVQNQRPTEADMLADAVARPTKPYSDMTFGMGKEGYPAICMTQLAAKMYCNWLTAKTGHYYRLPTEAEWEYACRAGTETAYSFGDDPAKLNDYAWSAANSDEKYHKVGQKKPNPWGLYDMHGNVAEWCCDQYVPDRYKQLTASGKVVDSPLALGNTEYPRLVRGGAWTDEAPLLRSAARRGSSKEWKQQDPQIPQSIWYFTDADFVGFRVIRPLRRPTPAEAAKYDLDESQKAALIDYKKAKASNE